VGEGQEAVHTLPGIALGHYKKGTARRRWPELVADRQSAASRQPQWVRVRRLFTRCTLTKGPTKREPRVADGQSEAGCTGRSTV